MTNSNPKGFIWETQSPFERNFNMKSDELRNNRVIVRLSISELKKLNEKQKILGFITLSAYIRELINNKNLVVNKVDFSGAEKLIYEINKIGTNINQIAHIANIEKNITIDILNHLAKEYKELKKLVLKNIKIIVKGSDKNCISKNN